MKRKHLVKLQLKKKKLAKQLMWNLTSQLYEIPNSGADTPNRDQKLTKRILFLFVPWEKCIKSGNQEKKVFTLKIMNRRKRIDNSQIWLIQYWRSGSLSLFYLVGWTFHGKCWMNALILLYMSPVNHQFIYKNNRLNLEFPNTFT